MISQREKGELARFYTVTDPRKHEKGYTVYKVTARIISRKNPEDIQEITVWKRYSDFRKLHRDLWQIHRDLFRHSDLFPPFAKAKVFGRFDDSVIEERRQCSEDLLQFSANIPALYSSQHIEDFFKDGEVQDGSELIGPAEPFSDFLADSLSDCSSEVPRDIGGADDLTITSQSEYGGPSSESDLISLLVDGDSLTELDDGMASGVQSPNQVQPQACGPTPPPTAQLREAACAEVGRLRAVIGPGVSISSSNSVPTSRAALFPSALQRKSDYLERAGELIRLAAQNEAQGDLQAALTHYRGGVDLLLQGVQGEVSPSRREAVKKKTAEYLMHAEQLSNQHAQLNDIMGQSSTQSAVLGSQCCRPSWSQQNQCEDLHNYRVLGVIDKVLLVMDKRTQETFILKGLRKSSECESGRVRRTIIPQAVPNMVRLRRLIHAQDSVFLLLDYAQGGKLWSHISKYLQSSSSPEDSFDIPFIQKSHTAAVHSVGPLTSNPGTGSGSLDSAAALPDASPNSSPLLGSGPGYQGRGLGPGGSAQQLSLRLGSGGSLGSLGSVRLAQEAQEEEQEDEEDELCTNSYLTLCNEYEQEKVEPEALGEEGEEEEEMQEAQEDSGAASAILPNTTRSHGLLSSDSLSSPLVSGSGMGFFGEDEGDAERSQTLSTTSELTEPVGGDSLERSKRSPVELFRINSKDSTGEGLPLEPVLNDLNGLNDLSTSDLGSEVTESLQELAEALEVKGQVTDLWHLDSDRASNDSVPVISFTEAAGGVASEEPRPPDLLVNLPGAGEGSDPLEEELVTTGISMAIEAKPSPKLGQPDVLQLDHDLGQEVDPDWSLDPDASSLSSALNSTADSLSHNHVAITPCGPDPDPHCPANTATLCGANTAAPASDALDQALSRRTSTSCANIPPGDPLLLASPAGSQGEQEQEVQGEGTPSKGRGEMDLGDVSQLFRALDERSVAAAQVRLPEKCVRRWAAELVLALETLHTQGIICRDLNPNNLLLTATGNIQLTFFCSCSEVEDACDREAVAKMYCAPEVGGICEETVACDWWSLGAILFELLTGKSLQQCHPAGISRHTFLSIPEFVSEEASSLLQQLLQFNPAERLGSGVAGAEDIKSHPFFTGVTWSK